MQLKKFWQKLDLRVEEERKLAISEGNQVLKQMKDNKKLMVSEFDRQYLKE